MNRRRFVQNATAFGMSAAFSRKLGALGVTSPVAAPGEIEEQTAFELNEITISALQRGMREGRYTARSVVELYLSRISALDHAGPKLHSVIEVNPDAIAIATALDAERKAGKVRGPLHGVPVLLKDVVDTADRMHTTAGSLALLRSIPPRDAFIAERLRAAGAILLGKTNLSEWSNARSTRATNGWSARGGLTRNAYVLDRTACGSSSGTGVSISANMATIGVGVETDGSIACPASANSLVGIKPTVGLVSRAGLIPVSYSFDTAGPVARSVTDAALLLGALAGVDPRDPVTNEGRGKATDYSKALDKAALKGARIGVLRRDLTESSPVSGVLLESLKAMQSAGAIIYDDIELPTFEDLQIPKAIVLVCELKDAMNEYLRQRGPSERHKSLADLIRFNEQNASVELKWFGQEFFETAERTRGRATPEYQAALTHCRSLTRANGLDRALSIRQLDAVVSLAANVPFTLDLLTGDHPIVRNSFVSAVAGYPRVTVPAGFVRGLPVGISFMGAPWTESRLIGLAYAFEQTVQARQLPRFLPTVDFNDDR